MKTSTPIETFNEADGYFKRSYNPKKENQQKLELFLKNNKDGKRN